MSDTERVTMVWPSALKEQVRERVGQRGLTSFVLEAVQTKLGTHDAVTQEVQETSKELNEARDLSQRMADLFVRQGDYEDPVEQLQELSLPAWISTTGWPSELAKLVPPEDSRLLVNNPDLVEPRPEQEAEAPPEPVMVEHGDGSAIKQLTNHFGITEEGDGKVIAVPAPDDEDDDLHRPMALTKPTGAPKADLFARIQSQVPGLKPASEILAPGGKPVEEVVVPIPRPEPELEPEPVEEPAPAAIAEVDKCPVCGSELVDGECWMCF